MKRLLEAGPQTPEKDRQQRTFPRPLPVDWGDPQQADFWRKSTLIKKTYCFISFVLYTSFFFFTTANNQYNCQWKYVRQYNSGNLQFVGSAFRHNMKRIPNKIIEKVLGNSHPKGAAHGYAQSPLQA